MEPETAMAKDGETEEFGKIVSMLDVMANDTSIPRNVRLQLQEAQKKLKTSEDRDVALSSAIYILDDVSNDINLPMHARTLVWNLMSELEMLKES